MGTEKKRESRAALFCAAAIWLLTGCGQKPFDCYPLDEVTASRIASIEESDRRVPGKAEDLCIVYGSEEDVGNQVVAAAAGLFSESDHQTIAQRNAFQTVYPASLTKVMTAIVALKEGNPDDMVTVGQEAVITEAGASLAKINPGDTLTLKQLLYGLLLPSGNDAAAAIAVHISGSVEAFAQRMNEEAQLIGAVGTHFMNPHGLHDSNHYTTVYDQYLIFHEALKFPEFREIIGTESYTAEYTDALGSPVTQIWSNSNKYLNGSRETPENLTVLGGKTGTTNAAGYCLIMASADASGNAYISVIMKSESRDLLYDGMTNIIRKITN